VVTTVSARSLARAARSTRTTAVVKVLANAGTIVSVSGVLLGKKWT
jgi:hypothetical protein